MNYNKEWEQLNEEYQINGSKKGALAILVLITLICAVYKLCI